MLYKTIRYIQWITTCDFIVLGYTCVHIRTQQIFFLFIGLYSVLHRIQLPSLYTRTISNNIIILYVHHNLCH